MNQNMRQLSYQIGQRSNGEELYLQAYFIEGDEPGPTSYFQTSVHGAELQGNLVIRELAAALSNLRFSGNIILVPMANPEAITQKSGQYTYGRFNPITGNNWNRNYYDVYSEKNRKHHSQSLTKLCQDFFAFHKKENGESLNKLTAEFKKWQRQAINDIREETQKRGPKHNGLLNLTLQEIASEADYVFDLHTGPKATRYLYSPELGTRDALHFGFPHILEIPHEFAGAMDEASFMPWVHLQETLKKDHDVEFEIPFRSYTLELGSEEHISSKDAERDAYGILRFLTNKGMISKKDFKKIQCQTWCEYSKKNISLSSIEDFVTYHAPYGGLTEFLFAPGEEFSEGQTLAIQYHPEAPPTSSPSEVKALKEGIVINHFTSASTPQGASLYQVMESVKKADLPPL